MTTEVLRFYGQGFLTAARQVVDLHVQVAWWHAVPSSDHKQSDLVGILEVLITYSDTCTQLHRISAAVPFRHRVPVPAEHLPVYPRHISSSYRFDALRGILEHEVRLGIREMTAQSLTDSNAVDPDATGVTGSAEGDGTGEDKGGTDDTTRRETVQGRSAPGSVLVWNWPE